MYGNMFQKQTGTNPSNIDSHLDENLTNILVWMGFFFHEGVDEVAFSVEKTYVKYYFLDGEMKWQ